MAMDWRLDRRIGMVAIAVSAVVTAAVWFAIWHWGPDMEGYDLAARMTFAAKCLALSALFTLVAGVEAVAHERLQSPAFDPLSGMESRRLRVNQRFLQNTLEQFVIHAVAIMGLALYAESGAAMRALLATAVIWVLGRWAFWIGYHRSVALRGTGMPAVIATMLALLYVSGRVGDELAGSWGAAVVLAAFFALEAFLFLKTRMRHQA